MQIHLYAKDNLGKRTIKAKKYFYILRPILVGKWVIAHRCPSPILFEELAADQLDAQLQPLVAELVSKKLETPELGYIPNISALDDYIYSELASLRCD